MKSKILYSTYSFSHFLKATSIKVCCIGAIIYLLIHFHENQVVISVIIAFLVLLLIAVGNDYIEIYNDRFEIKSDALVNISMDKKVYNYQNIESVSGEPKPSTSEVVTYAIFRLFIKSGNRDTRKLYIKLKNGPELIFHLDIYPQELLKVISMINVQLKK